MDAAPRVDSFEEMEQRLAGLEDEKRLELLLSLVEEHFLRLPGPVYDHGLEALALMERFPDDAREATLLLQLSRMQRSRGDYPSALDYAGRGRTLAESIGDRTLLAKALRRTADAQLSMSEYELALESISASRKIFEEVEDREGVAHTLTLEAAAYQMQGKYSEAVEVYLKALPVFESLNNIDGLGRVHNNVGLIHYELGQRDKAEEYWKRALTFARELDNDVLVASSLNNLGMVARQKGELEQARDFYLESLALKEKTGSKRTRANTLNNLGEVYKDLEQYEESLDYHTQSLTLRREIGDQKGTVRSLGGTGVLHAKMGRYDEALSYLTEALTLAESVGVRYEMSEAEEALAEVHAARGDFKQAYEELRRHNELSDELASRGTFDRLAKLQAFYETAQQAQEIEILRQNQNIQELQLSRQQMRQNALILVSLLLLGVATHLFTRYRARVRLLQTVRQNHAREAATHRERDRIEKAMLRAQKLESLGVLAGGIAHDFNNLLTTILGNASLALAEAAPNSPTRQYLERVESASDRAAELTNQMLAYSGQGAFLKQPIDLSHLVRETLPLIASSISKKAELRLELGENLPAVRADRSQLQQVVMNLLTNASDALGEASGSISVRTGLVTQQPGQTDANDKENAPANQRVFIEVEDDGCGMDEATKARIFDPFFSTKAAGRGLGLAAVGGILRSHGGQISVESSPNKRSLFRVILDAEDGGLGPIETNRSSVDEGGAPSPLAEEKATVLVVDDEENIRELACRALEKQGWRVLLAADGDEGVSVFHNHEREIDAVLLDLSMPRKDGAEVFEILRGMRSDVPVVLTSGYNENEATRKLGDTCRVSFLKKPFNANELVRALRSELV